MNQDQDFIKVLLQDVMPVVKRMIEKEEIHIQEMKLRKKDYEVFSKGIFFFRVQIAGVPDNEKRERLAEFDRIIAESEAYLSHYRNRLHEYEEYAIKNW